MSLLLPCLASGQTVVINELQAKNGHTLADEFNQYDDWIELTNRGSQAVDIGGFYLTDDLQNPARWRIPTGRPDLTIMPPGGYLLIWAAGRPDQGPLHASFSLDASGEAVGLFAADGITCIDSITFQDQQADQSYARIPDGGPYWQVTDQPTPGRANLAGSRQVVINEIMYHPLQEINEPENIGGEFIELCNVGTAEVNVSGWRFSKGVGAYTIPEETRLPAGGFLVVAADVNAFKAGYPTVSPVVGGWPGKLSNSGETIELVDRNGLQIDCVTYSDEGDWGVRELGPVELSHRGWQWSDQADGGGYSLELINPAMPNEYGQNWAAGKAIGGTPGRANSVAAADAAPFILDAAHSPIIPGPNQPVTVAARVIDELTSGVTVVVRYRVDKSTYKSSTVYPSYKASDYTNAVMFDDGAHGDGLAGDGVYGGQIPAMPNGTIIEFFVQATDAGGKSRTWPAPSMIDGVSQQVTNLLYQVDRTFDPTASWVPGQQPVYTIIMTEMERGRLAAIVKSSTNQGPNSQMNATFISVDGMGVKVQYNAGVRDRGHGSRTLTPNQYHVVFPNDRPWKGVTAVDLNTNWTHVEVAGGAIYALAGIAQPDCFPVQVRVNGQNLAASVNLTLTCGSYAHLENPDNHWAKHHFPDDSDGNLYKCMRDDATNQEANLNYLGANPNSYRVCYFKHTNASEEDWSDLIELAHVISNPTTSDEVYAQQVEQVIDVDEWLRFLAVNTLVENKESSIGNGTGDEYYLYRGVDDKRFVLIQWDMEAMFGLGDETPRNTSVGGLLFKATNIPAMNRFLKHPQFAPRYYGHLKDLMDTVFSDKPFGQTIDEQLGGWVPTATVAKIKSFISQRNATILAAIPLTISVTTSLPKQGGYNYTTSSLVSLTGQANAITTRSVAVNGQPATWTAWQATWLAGRVTLVHGLNHIVIQAYDANGVETDRSSIDIWSDAGSSSVEADRTSHAIALRRKPA